MYDLEDEIVGGIVLLDEGIMSPCSICTVICLYLQKKSIRSLTVS